MTPPLYPPGAPDGAASVPDADPLAATDLAGWVRRIVDTVRRSIGPLLAIHLVVAAVGAVLTFLSGTGQLTPEDVLAGRGVGGLLPLLLAQLVLAAGAAAMSVHIVVTQATGAPADPGAAFGFAGNRLLPLVGWTVVAGLLIGIGALLILPAVYLVVVFAATLYGVVVIERGGIGRCFILVHRRLVPTFARVALLVTAGLGYVLVLGLLTSGLEPGSLAAVVVGSVLGALAGVVQIVASVVTYAELRHHEQPWVGTSTLAAELYR